MDEETVVGLVREIQALQSELEDVEAKRAAGGLPHSIEESLSALANRPGGGAILFGLDEEGGFVPCTVYDVAQLQADLASRASDEMNPPVRVSFTLVDIEGCTVIYEAKQNRPVVAVEAEFDGMFPGVGVSVFHDVAEYLFCQQHQGLLHLPGQS